MKIRFFLNKIHCKRQFIFQSERVKQLLNTRSLLNLPYNDPHAALQRDSFATSENKIDEAGIRAVVNQQTASLDNLILQYKKSQLRMQMILKEAEERHRKVVFFENN